MFNKTVSPKIHLKGWLASLNILTFGSGSISVPSLFKPSYTQCPAVWIHWSLKNGQLFNLCRHLLISPDDGAPTGKLATVDKVGLYRPWAWNRVLCLWMWEPFSPSPHSVCKLWYIWVFSFLCGIFWEYLVYSSVLIFVGNIDSNQAIIFLWLGQKMRRGCLPWPRTRNCDISSSNSTPEGRILHIHTKLNPIHWQLWFINAILNESNADHAYSLGEK